MVKIFRKKLVLAAVAALVLAAVVGPLAARALASPPDVPTAKVKRETLSVTVTVSGKTEPEGGKDVFPPVAGTLERVLVTEGQQVKAGQALAEMDVTALDAQVLAARAAYRAAQAQIDGADAQSPTSADYEAADESVRAAKAAYDRASAGVGQASAAGGAALDAAKAQRDQAKAAYAQAKSAKRKLGAASGASDSQRSAAIAQRAQAKAALDVAQANRAGATLKAPIDGVVLFNTLAPSPTGPGQKATDGCAVSPAVAPFTVVPADSARFAAQADEVDVARIKPGDKAVVKLDAFPGEKFVTTVASIRPEAVQTKTGGTAFPVLLALAKTGKAVRVGMSGNAEIAVDSVKGALTIPADALIDEKDGSFVFVVRDGKVRKTAVETGAMTDTRIQIVDGLKEGDVVAVPATGTSLTDGMSVKAGR